MFFLWHFFDIEILLLLTNTVRNSRIVGADEECTTQIIKSSGGLSTTTCHLPYFSYATPFTLLKIFFESVLNG